MAEPGVDAADLAPGSADGGALLCVAAVTRGKGHDVLLGGLATVTDLAWRCACVGSLDRAPAFADHVQRRALAGGLRDRVHFAGPRTGAALDSAYAAADLLVLASHGETYGMVVTEALARGVPVLATDVGGVPEALGHGTAGLGSSSRPATRRPSARRCAAGSRTPSCASGCGGPRGSGARPCPAGRTPRRRSPPRSASAPACPRGRRHERDRRPLSRVARAARAGGRGGAVG